MTKSRDQGKWKIPWSHFKVMSSNQEKWKLSVFMNLINISHKIVPIWFKRNSSLNGRFKGISFPLINTKTQLPFLKCKPKRKEHNCLISIPSQHIQPKPCALSPQSQTFAPLTLPSCSATHLWEPVLQITIHQNKIIVKKGTIWNLVWFSESTKYE